MGDILLIYNEMIGIVKIGEKIISSVIVIFLYLNYVNFCICKRLIFN